MNGEPGTGIPRRGCSSRLRFKDGLFAAAALNMFNRHSPVLAMTSTAQTANVLQALLLSVAQRHFSHQPTMPTR